MLYSLNNDVGHKHVYCGPGAIAIVTGQPVSKIEKMIRRYRNEITRQYNQTRRYSIKAQIKSMYNHEVRTVLKRLKVKVNTLYPSIQTLRQFVDDTQYEKYPYIVQVTGHYVVTYRGRVMDNQLPLLTSVGCRRPKRHIMAVMQIIT